MNENNNTPKRKKLSPDFKFMVTALVAFACTIIVIIVQTNNTEPQLGGVMKVLAPMAFIAALLVPVITRADAYSEFFRTQSRTGNFSASFAINQYGLHGWINGKYKFLEAISEACNGNFEHAFELYTECLANANDRRLRSACYRDMVKNLNRMDSKIRLVPYIRRGCEEFPDEKELFDWLASYYMWYRYAEEAEALEWFCKVAETTNDNTIRAKAYFYIGLTALYKNQYEIAERNLESSYTMSSRPACYLCVDLAVCKACLKKYDEARSYAVQALMLADSQEDMDYITEKISYMFSVTENDINTETEKLAEEMKRRREYELENSVKITDIERFNAAVEKAKYYS